MIYNNIRSAKFLRRPNRFIAHIEIEGKEEICHVKNTGRCRELLTENAAVYVQEFDNHKRKTKYDLISVYKGKKLINMDSQVPNKVFHEWVQQSTFLKNITKIKPEHKYNNSRFDFYIEADERKILIEVKGVTLEENGVVLFPDAPTERGVKHLNELVDSIGEGYDAYIVFIIQMKDVNYFTPNINMHNEFAEALKKANQSGVNIIALDCEVTENSIKAKQYVEVKL